MSHSFKLTNQSKQLQDRFADTNCTYSLNSVELNNKPWIVFKY